MQPRPQNPQPIRVQHCMSVQTSAYHVPHEAPIEVLDTTRRIVDLFCYTNAVWSNVTSGQNSQLLVCCCATASDGYFLPVNRMLPCAQFGEGWSLIIPGVSGCGMRAPVVSVGNSRPGARTEPKRHQTLNGFSAALATVRARVSEWSNCITGGAIAHGYLIPP